MTSEVFVDSGGPTVLPGLPACGRRVRLRQPWRLRSSPEVLESLPEETSLEDIQYHLYVLQRIERGRAEVRAGRVIPRDEVERRMNRWLEK